MGAMTWIAVAVDLPDHPKTQALSATLGEPNAEAYLLRLWAWCARFARDGVVRGQSADIPRTVCGQIVESAARWKGTPGQLFEALLATGWVDEDNGGSFMIHDWSDHAGKLIKKAESERRRKASERGEIGDDASATCPRIVRGQSAENDTDSPRNASLFSSLSVSDSEKGVQGEESQPSGPSPADLQRVWNELAPKACPRWQQMPKARAAAARARIAEHANDDGGPLAWWASVVDRVAASPFLRGDKTDFVAKPDWILAPSNLVKVLEGNYDERQAQRDWTKGRVGAEECHDQHIPGPVDDF